MEYRFFYTMDYPYRMTPGPTMNNLDPMNGWRPIDSLGRARELAKRFAHDSMDRDRVVTTYGVEYIDDVKPAGQL
jgi:hypothetical protein